MVIVRLTHHLFSNLVRRPIHHIARAPAANCTRFIRLQNRGLYIKRVDRKCRATDSDGHGRGVWMLT